MCKLERLQSGTERQKQNVASRITPPFPCGPDSEPLARTPPSSIIPALLAFNPDAAVADAVGSEPGVNRQWRRHVRAPCQSRCDNLAILRACLDTATPCTGHGGLLRGTTPVASLRKGRPRLPEYLSIAESGLKKPRPRVSAARFPIGARYRIRNQRLFRPCPLASCRQRRNELCG